MRPSSARQPGPRQPGREGGGGVASYAAPIGSADRQRFVWARRSVLGRVARSRHPGEAAGRRYRTAWQATRGAHRPIGPGPPAGGAAEAEEATEATETR